MEANRSERIARLPATIGLVAFDFDGVLTDNRVIVGVDGSEQVICSRADGMGVTLLREAGIEMVVLSSEPHPVVQSRCAKLGVPAYQGLTRKVDTLRALLAERDLEPANVVFVGNDVNDAECLALAGCAVVPADAHPAVLPLADIVLTCAGGRGAVRELADLILEAGKGLSRKASVA